MDKSGLSAFVDILVVLFGYLLFIFAAMYFANADFSLIAPFKAIKGHGIRLPEWFKYSALGAGSFIAVGLLFNPFRGSGGYGAAHFATEKEIKSFQLRNEKGLILGMKGNKYLRTDEPLSVLVYAPPGTGKTAGIIIPSLLSCGNSAIVHDPKGELYEKTGPRRSQFSKVFKFSPAESDSVKWNPLSRTELPEEWSRKIVAVERIAHSIVPSPKGDEDNYFVKEARSVLMFFALYLIHKNGETSLPEIRELSLSSGDVQMQIAQILTDDPGLPQRIKEEGNGLVAKAEKEFSGVFGSFKSAMNVFGDPYVSENLRSSEFSLRSLRQERTTIYLVVKNSDQTRLRDLLSMFFETAVLIFIEKEPDKSPNSKDFKITLFLDEFVRLGRMGEVINLPAISRSYWVNVIYICQSFSQLVGIYGQAGADQLRNSSHYHVIFSQNEQRIAEDISRSIGNFTRKKRSYSSSQNIMRNSSESEEGRALVLPQEIMSLPDGEILLLVRSHFQTPIQGKAALWYKDPALTALVK